MPTQTYANHAHRPTLTIVAFVCIVISIAGFVNLWRGGMTGASVTAFGGLLAAVIVLTMISRSYTTSLQDRIIRVEMAVRCAALLTPAQQRTLQGLELRRIAALRFASDEELPALLDRAARESLSPADIKRAIKTWVPDHNRT